MKRKIALLIIVILALSVALVACNPTAKTTIRVRWKEETHVYSISLADFASNTLSDEIFNFYDIDGNPIDRTGNNADSIYCKDVAFSNEFKDWDEVRPLAVKGTYTVKIKPSTDGTSYCDVETTQEMCVKYSLTDFKDLNEMESAKATAEQLAKYKLTEEDNTVILWSSTETAVRFENVPAQKPLSSSTKVNGFYVGKIAQMLTNYEITTTYDYEGKSPVATVTLKTADDEKTEDVKISSTVGNFIDSNQILMYLRSLEKSTDFPSSPSVSVFNPYTKTSQTANFGMSRTFNVILTNPSHQDSVLATKLPVVSVTIGRNSFMVQESLPSTLAEHDLDLFSKTNTTDKDGNVITTKVSNFTTVRFRVGYFAYEIDYAAEQNTANWDEIWAALVAKPSEEENK